MENDLLFFQGFDKLINIKTSNKSNQSTVEKYVRHWAKCAKKVVQKFCKKQKNEKCKNSSFWLCMDFICTNSSSFSGKSS